MESRPDRRARSLLLQTTTFVGREQELVDVANLLDSSRLLTLTGAGGIGKSRLAVEVAARVGHRFPDGVAFVELNAVTDPARVPQAVAAQLGLSQGSDPSLTDMLAEALLGKHLLVLLDNCEQVKEGCADLADRLCRSCPSLRILATSREPLGSYAETRWPVSLLSLPNNLGAVSVDEASRSDAVRLFVDRARAVVPGFVLSKTNLASVVEVCRRSDGLPLAIELAAAHSKILSPSQMVSRLDEGFLALTEENTTLPPRQRTMRASFMWSYHLLSDQERDVFDRLCIFNGGFSLEASEQICADQGIASDSVPRLLGRLVDKSLVVVGLGQGEAVRFRVLEPFRHCGVERLRERGALEGAEAACAKYFLGLAESSHCGFGVVDKTSWQTRLEEDHENLQAARSYFIRSGRNREAVRLAAAVQDFLVSGRHVAEGQAWLEETLQLPEASVDVEARMRLLHGGGVLTWNDGNRIRARDLLSEALLLSDQIKDSSNERAHLLFDYGRVLSLGGEIEKARTLLDEAAAIARSRTNAELQVQIVLWHAVSEYVNGNDEEASVYAYQLMSLSAAAQLYAPLANAFCVLGRVASNLNDFALAEALLEQGVMQARRHGRTGVLAWCLAALADISLERRDFERVRSLLIEALQVWRDVNNRWGIAMALDGFTCLAAARSESDRAIRLAGAAATSWEAAASVRARSAIPRLQEYIGKAVSNLGHAAARAACLAGRCMSPEEAISYALSGEQTLARADASASGRAGEATLDRLSPRERDVVRLLARGYTNRQIAQQLFISEATVATHVWHIFDKLELRSRALVAARAQEFSLV